MVCISCGRNKVNKLNDLCPVCAARVAAGRKPAPVAAGDDGTTRPVPKEREHRPLPGGDTGRLKELRRFIEELHW